jgi:hypothetical protein
MIKDPEHICKLGLLCCTYGLKKPQVCIKVAAGGNRGHSSAALPASAETLRIG